MSDAMQDIYPGYDDIPSTCRLVDKVANKAKEIEIMSSIEQNRDTEFGAFRGVCEGISH